MSNREGTCRHFDLFSEDGPLFEPECELEDFENFAPAPEEASEAQVDEQPKAVKRRITTKTSPKALREMAAFKLGEMKRQAESEWRMHESAQNSKARYEASRMPLEAASKGSEGRHPLIHESHIRMALVNYIFCRRCGLFMTTRCGGLKIKCNGAPSNKTARERLVRMMEGRHPVCRKHWDDGTSTKHRGLVTCIDMVA